MADSAQQAKNRRVTKVVLACVGSGTLLFLILAAFWGYQVYKHRGYHLKHLRKLDKEADDLNEETMNVRGEVDLDVSADETTKLKNLEMLTSAEEWDAAIRTALSAWGELVEESKRALGIVKQSQGKVDIGRKKGYVISIIGIMREKSIEGIETRKGLSPQLQKIYAEAHARRVCLFKNKMNSRAPSSLSGQRSINAKTIRPSPASMQSESLETLHQTDKRSKKPSRALSEVDVKSDKLGGLRIYI